MGREAAAPRRLAGLIALVAIPLLVHLAIIGIVNLDPDSGFGLGRLIRIGFVTGLALTHWTIYGGLLATFALTLRPGHEALITAMTRRLHGTIRPDLAVYTRRVTIAWSCFFAAQLITSVGLFVFAPLVVWSFFVNILDIPLVVAMFAAEYAYRLRYVRDPPRHSLSAIVAMITDIRQSEGIRKPQGEAVGPSR